MKVVNKTGEDRLVPLPDGDTVRVASGDSFDTTDVHAESLAEQDGWTIDKKSKRGDTAEETDQ